MGSNIFLWGTFFVLNIPHLPDPPIPPIPLIYFTFQAKYQCQVVFVTPVW